jgi:hypothetical protein
VSTAVKKAQNKANNAIANVINPNNPNFNPTDKAQAAATAVADRDPAAPLPV